MTAVDRLLATARAEIGYLEKATNAQLDDKTANAGDKNFTKYAHDLDQLGVYHAPKNGFAWCDMFVDWCFVQTFGLELGLAMTCQPKGAYGAGCTESRNYYRAKGRYFTSDPQPGDQIFFSNDGGNDCCHTGIVEKVEDGRVYTIEGNTGSAPGVVPNGGCVREKSYTLSYSQIAGYGRPDYSMIEEDDDDMDSEKFRELWMEMRKSLQDNDSSGYSKDARQWAVETGLIEGDGKLPSGENNYMWQDILTREQFVTVLYRFAKRMGQV